MEKVDAVVIGAGVVGLAIARALALAGREVLLLEAEGAIGTGTSSRNSEVIHAGIYYPTGSLKALLCVRGKQLLVGYCDERGVSYRRCGKLIVATSEEELSQLTLIQAQARSNGVNDLARLTRDEIESMEPQLRCAGALHSPSTGIIDSHAYMMALQGDFEHAGGMVALNSPVERAVCGGSRIEVHAQDGTVLGARTVVNSAGLSAIPLARKFEGLDAVHVPRAFYCKGSYFTLSGRAPFSRLVYPVPHASGGLGVHLTIDLGGQAKFGPDAEWTDRPDDLVVDPARREAFCDAIRKFWPQLKEADLAPGYAGMRPKIHGPAERARDFMVQGPQEHGVPGLVNLFGIESPGLTSSLALGEYVASLGMSGSA